MPHDRYDKNILTILNSVLCRVCLLADVEEHLFQTAAVQGVGPEAQR